MIAACHIVPIDCCAQSRNVWYNPFMDTYHLHRAAFTSENNAETTETIEQFLSRGGSITYCPPRPASGSMAYAPVIAVDGYELPTGTGGNEYLPNYVRDVESYDSAQSEQLTVMDDGVDALVRADVSRTTSYLVSSHLQSQQRARRDGADGMEA